MVFKRKIDYDAAKQMRLDEKSYKEIGDVYGVSRQAVYMALDPDISGPDALRAFAAAMRNTNAKVWATGKVEH